MTWELVYTVPLTQTIRPILIERVFEKSVLIVEAIAVDAKPTWYKAGFLYPVLDISDVGKVRNFGQAINLNKQLVKFEELKNIPFQLEFVAYSWIPSIILNFWESDMPSYSSSPVFNGITSNVTPSTVAVSNTTSTLLSATTVGKLGSTITNNSKVGKLYLSIGSAASLTNYDKILGYLETFETPFNWSGDIFGIWDKADAAGNAKVKDFS